MSELHSQSGWVRLHSGFDLELTHGIPVRLSDNGQSGTVDDAKLDDEISSLSGLRTTILGWHKGESGDELETELSIDALQFEEVLKRLALASAALFVDRFHKPIAEVTVDWDKMEYDQDFNKAIEHCGLQMSDYNKEDYFAAYKDCMHKESKRLIEEGVNPFVDPE